jgi:tripartite-type tricarboxylate transporter receptor subunit TctC
MVRPLRLQLVGAACALFAAGALWAQPAARAGNWPERPVRVIAPTLAGGPTDVIIRIVIGKLAESFEKPFIVDNRPGAGGLIGTDTVAKAPRDGHTLLFTYAAHSIIPFIYPQVPYDVHRDFAPITMTSMQPLLLAVHAGVKANTVQELVAYGKANPGKLNLALASPAGSGALAAELFKMVTATDMVTVPFKGAAQAMPALLTGEMHLIFTSLPSVLPHVKGGKVRVLGVASLKRSQFMPEVPTLIEAGLRDFNTSPWQGLLAPAGTPSAVIELLHRRVIEALKVPELRQRLAAVGTEVEGSSPKEFAVFLQRELAQNSKVIKAAGMKAE